MPRPQPPLRAVVSTELGPRSQRIWTGTGYAIVCGPPARTDSLECGHVVTTWGGRAARRRCPECADNPPVLELVDPDWPPPEVEP